MTSLPPLYQRLLDARNAFRDIHLFKTPIPVLGQSQALLDTVNALVDAFVLGLPHLSRPSSPDEVGAARAQLKNVVDAYILDIREGVERLEEHVGDSGLRFYADALEQVMHGEIRRLSEQAQTR